MGCSKTEPTLPQLNIDSDLITVSGISSGGYMANQYHIAYSDQVSGAAMLASGPFGCAKGDLKTALTSCMNNPKPLSSEPFLILAKIAEKEKTIAKIENLSNDKVWIFHGKEDSTVSQSVTQSLVSFYQELGVDVSRHFDLSVGHGFPTKDKGVICAETKSPYLNQCQFDGAGSLLSFLLGDLKAKSLETKEHQTGKVVPFDQSKYLEPGQDNTLADTGYVYLPTSCLSGERCKLHMVLHGCQQNVDSVSMTFIENNGINEWADSNNLVVVYPQTKSTFIPLNPKACWDWWGYTGTDYLSRDGAQLKHLNNIVKGISSRVIVE